MNDNKQLPSKQEGTIIDSSGLVDPESSIVTDAVRTDSVTPSITLQCSTENTPRNNDVTGRSDVTGRNDVTTVNECEAEEADLLVGDRPAVDERLTQRKPHHHTVDETFGDLGDSEDRTRPEVLGPVHDLVSITMLSSYSVMQRIAVWKMSACSVGS